MALTTCEECDEEISKKADKCPKCGSPQKKKTSFFTWLVTIIIVLWAVGYFSMDQQTGTTSTKREPSPKQAAMENVKLDYSWSKGAFGNVMEANFTITNNSKYQIKDIEITCSHYAKSGTRIDSNERTIYDVVPEKGKKTFEKFNMGFIHSQAEKTDCTITDLKV